MTYRLTRRRRRLATISAAESNNFLISNLENAKGPRKEEDYIYSAVRECYDDWWEEEGQSHSFHSLVCSVGA